MELIISSLFALTILGIIDTFLLYWQYLQLKRQGRQMICPFTEHCEDVVNSKYGKTFVIKNELIGIVYYVLFFLLLLAFTFYPSSRENLFVVIFIFSTVAFIFSSYLLFIQVFILRKFCFWCLVDIGINYTIFILVSFFLTAN